MLAIRWCGPIHARQVRADPKLTAVEREKHVHILETKRSRNAVNLECKDLDTVGGGGW